MSEHLGTVGTGGVLHTAIRGDNLDVLPTMADGSVDACYIDPPYNTGNSHFSYGDRRTDWTGFMEPRIAEARRLLSPSGVIMCSVGDAELGNYRVLADRIFGAKNFVSMLVWQGRRSYLSRFDSGGCDYIVVHARTRSKARPWREPKPLAEEMMDAARSAPDTASARAALRRVLDGADPGDRRGLGAYTHVTDDGRVFCHTKLDNALHRPNLHHPITDPATGEVHWPPSEKGWIAEPATMERWISEGRVDFSGPRPRKVQFLDETATIAPDAVFEANRASASAHLDEVLGRRWSFPHPKNHEVLARWLGMATGPDAHVLDFFAGSGSTGEAVLDLNDADGGTRRFTLVTSEEGGIFDDVLRPRLTILVTGVRPDGSVRDGGRDARVEFRTTSAP